MRRKKIAFSQDMDNNDRKILAILEIKPFLKYENKAEIVVIEEVA